MAAQTSSTYSGPFESLYEEHEALQGNRGNQAQHMAAQAQHSRGLQAKGLQDTSAFGTNRSIFGKDKYTTPAQNPLNVLMDFQGPAAAARMQTSARSLPNKYPLTQGAGPQGTPLMSAINSAPTAFFPSLAGQGPTGAPGFLGQMGDNYAAMREAAGMGIANIASGGAFSSDPNVKMQKFLMQGFSPEQAQRYIRGTEENAQRQFFQNKLYGDRINERGGTQETQATAATGEADPTADPNYIPPHLRYLMERQQPVTTMSMGGLMALGPMMQQQQYEMGRQMAMRDMGVSV